MEPLLIVSCEEKNKIVERKVYPFVATKENIFTFWEQASKYPYIFGMKNNGSIEDFLNIFFSEDDRGFWRTEHLFYVVDDFVGVLALTNIYYPYDALMHFTFFDGRLRGRETIIRGMIEYVFDKYKFNRLSAEIPCVVRDEKSSLPKFVSERVGLILEGKKRKAMEFKDSLCDVLMYGITQEDIRKWDSQKPRQ
jgi:RimJ/RimL family protein N-acetyltransferase